MSALPDIIVRSDHDVDRDIGRGLRSARERLGVNMGQLADALGCTVGHVSDRELGRVAWSPEMLREHLAALASVQVWCSMPSREEILAHNARTGGDCFGPWLVRRCGKVLGVAWLAVCDDGDIDVDADADLDLDAGGVEWSPIARSGDSLPWPGVNS